jgi:hypothetical protein
LPKSSRRIATGWKQSWVRWRHFRTEPKIEREVDVRISHTSFCHDRSLGFTVRRCRYKWSQQKLAQVSV